MDEAADVVFDVTFDAIKIYIVVHVYKVTLTLSRHMIVNKYTLEVHVTT